MTWFMVDDKFHSHKKAVRAGVAAIGLWTLAGSWAADQLTDGWVPDYIAARMDIDYAEHAHQLVEAGLWIEEEIDGDKGWRFHDWEAFQKTRDEVMEKRAEARERMRRAREKQQGSSSEVRANTSRSSQGVRSTPAHTQPEGSKEPSSDAAQPRPRKKSIATYLPEDFTVTDHMAQWARENCPDVDGRYETEQFVDYWLGEDAKKRDWNRTWYRWMRKAQKDASEKRARTGEPLVRYVPKDKPRCARHPRQLADHCALCAADAKGAAA